MKGYEQLDVQEAKDIFLLGWLDAIALQFRHQARFHGPQAIRRELSRRGFMKPTGPPDECGARAYTVTSLGHRMIKDLHSRFGIEHLEG